MPCNITVQLRGAKSSGSLAKGGNCPLAPLVPTPMLNVRAKI